jgi:hypothetical protein
MLKGKSLLAAGAIALLCGGLAQAGEMTTNGGFESGTFSGWTQFPGNGTQTIVTPGKSGTYAAELKTGSGVDDEVIKQANLGAGSIPDGAAVTVSFDMRGTAVNGAVAFAEFFSEKVANGTNKSEILSGGPLFPNADPTIWTHFSFTTTVASTGQGGAPGGVTLQLKSSCGAVAGCSADYFFDNVSVDVAGAGTAVPVPASLWLLGSALLGGLGVFRRKAVNA